MIDSTQTHINLCWIFLSLCIGGVKGDKMLENGVTRDVFLLASNPKYREIRDIVISGFAEMGRIDNIKDSASVNQSFQGESTLKKIQVQANRGTSEAYKKGSAENTINVLLKFSQSKLSSFQLTAYRSLRYYILLNHDDLMDDLSDLLQAFVNGSMSEDKKVQDECAKSLAFILTNMHSVAKMSIEDFQKNPNLNLLNPKIERL